MAKAATTANEELRDLGFGTLVATRSTTRLLNSDGTFNVRITGRSLRDALSLYNWLITMSWPRFVALLGSGYLLTNGLFAMGYLLCGPGSLSGPAGPALRDQFEQAFFFSVHTVSTLGYGYVIPVGLKPQIVMTLESMVGLFMIALSTGLVFARFSRPTAKILFSRNALIAPYRNITAFEFRIVNRRKSQLVELEAKVLFSRMEGEGERRVRRFYLLPLERDKVAFFPLSWTIVHPIDEASPLRGVTAEECHRADAEFLILLTGIDETFSQTVHTRSSYKPDEIVWNASFVNLYDTSGGGPITGDVRRLHEIKRP